MNTRTYKLCATGLRFHCDPDDGEEELEAILTCDGEVGKPEAARIMSAIHPDFNLKSVTVEVID